MTREQAEWAAKAIIATVLHMTPRDMEDTLISALTTTPSPSPAAESEAVGLLRELIGAYDEQELALGRNDSMDLRMFAHRRWGDAKRAARAFLSRLDQEGK